MSARTVDVGAAGRIEPAEFAATAAEFDVNVLDVHGVLLNRPLGDFLVDLGERTGEGGSALVERWRRDLRRPFWEGTMTESTMWAALAPGNNPTDLHDELESRFAAGPLLRVVLESDHRTWVLSNHRTSWLLPRLERFGLRGRFERTLVSDRIGAAKPSPHAFDEIVDLAGAERVRFVDDQVRNVDRARSLGITALVLSSGRA